MIKIQIYTANCNATNNYKEKFEHIFLFFHVCPIIFFAYVGMHMKLFGGIGERSFIMQNFYYIMTIVINAVRLIYDIIKDRVLKTK